MMLTLLAAAMLVPPPPMGDDRTAFLSSINRFLGALDGNDPAAFAQLLDRDGRLIRIDLRPDGGRRVSTLGQFIDKPPTVADGFVERIGIPTVQQRGPMAEVWAPYSFWIKGKRSHCGIDQFSMEKGADGTWKVVSLRYTIEAVANCDALAAPTNAK
jgi:hypothetical protein